MALLYVASSLSLNDKLLQLAAQAGARRIWAWHCVRREINGENMSWPAGAAPARNHVKWRREGRFFSALAACRQRMAFEAATAQMSACAAREIGVASACHQREKLKCAEILRALGIAACGGMRRRPKRRARRHGGGETGDGAVVIG